MSVIAELTQLRKRIDELTSEGATILALVDEQAKDAGLWFAAQSAAEAYVQAELRRLHEVIEGKSGDEIARDLVSTRRTGIIECMECGEEFTGVYCPCSYEVQDDAPA